jgi:hypothetical protein
MSRSYRVGFTVDTGKTACTYYTETIGGTWRDVVIVLDTLSSTDGVLKAWVEEQEINWTKVP